MAIKEFEAKCDLICWLVADLADRQGQLDPGMVNLLERLAGKALFFVPKLAGLNGRALQILKAAKAEGVPSSSNLLGKEDLYRAINVNEGMSLWAALKVIDTIQGLAGSRNPEYRELVSVRGNPLQFESGCIVPSFYHIDPVDVRRFYNGKDAFHFANEVFQGALNPNSIRLLEVGESSEDRYTEFRVTAKFAHFFVEELNRSRASRGEAVIPFQSIFSPDPFRGPRNGQNTRALRRANGNLIEGISSTRGDRPH
jgi:hypothetical protein